MIYFKTVTLSIPLNFIRKYSVKIKSVVVPDENVLNNIEKGVFKPRKHPGILIPKTIIVPDEFVKAVVAVMQDYPVRTLIDKSEAFIRHLKGRVPPMEKEEVKGKTRQIHERVLSKMKDVIIENEEDEKRFNQMVHEKVKQVLKEKIYNWRPVKYDSHHSLLYLMSRSAAEYAVLTKIFGEISSRDPDFKPKSLFDFGSGVGTATWAARTYWKKHIFEYFNVDTSREMNDLAVILLQGGKGSGSLPKGVFYRQFLPASPVKYDLVVCAYSLLELPSLESRLQTLVNLWNRTDQYLVVIEQGTNAGFKIINEIRDFILQIQSKSNKGHVFSPCPHDNTCPRFLLDDGTPCNFEIKYFTLPVAQKSQCKHELYSYVVLKKGERNEEELKWPRIVRSTLVRSKHTICRICTAKGELSEVIFTASKHGKATYHCARSSQWGDLLPVTVDFKEVNVEDKKVKRHNFSERNEAGSNTCDETISNDTETNENNLSESDDTRSSDEAIDNNTSKEPLSNKDCKNTDFVDR